MTKKEWTIVLLPLLITWMVDFLTKIWAADIVGIQDYGFLRFVLHKNYGTMLGLFSDLSVVLRVVSLSTGGAFLLCSYTIIQYLLPIKSLILRSGMSILIGGIIGNVTDRILWGYVIDFIVISDGQWFSPAFNLADALQWVGYLMIVYALIKESEILWPEHNLRKNTWINKKFQIRYATILTSIGLGLALIAGVFSYTYLRVTILELVGDNNQLLQTFLTPYIIIFSVIFVFFASLLFLIGKTLSHRSAGPVYAFEQFCNDLINDKPRPLKLRQKDDFKELEDLAQRLIDNYQKRAEDNSKKKNIN